MIRKSKQIIGVWLCILLAGQGFAQTGDILSRLDENLAEASRYEYGQSRESLSAINEIIKVAVDSPEMAKQVEKHFIDFLKSDATLAGKQFICRKLSVIGTKASVSILSEMLNVEETFDMALYALEKNPSSGVDKVLFKAMHNARGKNKIGLINTLGIRRYTPAIDALQKLISHENGKIAVAAIRAMAQMGDERACQVLLVAYQNASGQIRTEAMNGYLQCADGMVNQGRIDEARSMYQRFLIPDAIRSAALTGMIHAQPDRAGEIVLDAIRGDDDALKSIAIRHVGRLEKIDHLREIADELPRLSSLQQIQLVAALAERGDPAFRNVIVEAANDDDVEVRIAAVKALAFLGNASTVDLLLKKAVMDGPEQEAARESLYRIRGSDVDRVIVSRLATADSKTKIELLAAIGKRYITSATETVFQYTKDDASLVRQEAIKTLGLIGTAHHLPDVIDVLIAAQTEDERRESERTVVTLSRQIDDEDNQAKDVLAALPKAKTVESKSALLEVMGRIGDVHALSEIRGGLQHKDGEIRKASLRALSQWPNAEPAKDLLGVVEKSEDNVLKILALRGYIQLTGIDRELKADDKVKMYARAFQLSTEINEKRLILSGLANVRSLQALELAGQSLDDSSLRQEAEVAVLRIAGQLWQENPQRVLSFLNRIVRTTTHEDQRNNAQRLIQRIRELEK